MLSDMIRSREAGAAIDPYAIVTFATPGSGAAVAPATSGAQPLVGTTGRVGGAPGELLDVASSGFPGVRLGGTVLAGDPLTSDATSRAVRAADGDFIIGYADAPGAADDVIPFRAAPGIHRAAIVETGAPSTLLAWSMARSKVRTGASDVARVAFVGDSKTMGAGAGTGGTGYTAGAFARSRPMRVAAQLAAAGYNVRGDTWFGAAGLGSVAEVLLYDPRRSGFNGWGGGNNSLGGGMLAGPNSNPAVFQPSVAVDRCSVFYRNGADRPSFTVAKGSESFTITPTGAAGGLARGEVVFATRDTGAISVARSGNAGSLHLGGMVAWDSTKPGIEVANLGVFGVIAGFYTDTTLALSPLNALALYAPHLTVINLGSNDIAQNVPQATWLANLRTIVGVAKASGSVLLTWPSVGGAANSFGQDQTRLLWSAALRALASELGCAFVNEEALLGGRTAAQANGAFRDGIHEVDWAYDMEAAAIRQAIA